MKRIIIQAPENISLETLTPEQQAAIRSVFAQWAMPMPGTKASAGHILIDAVVGDNFDPADITVLGLPFNIIGLWQWDGSNTLVELQALNVSFIDYLPNTHTYDPATYALLTTTPPALHEPHRWSGWPEIQL